MKSKPSYRRVLMCVPLLLLMAWTALAPTSGRAADEAKPPFVITPAKIPALKVTLRSVKPIDDRSLLVLVGDEGTIARSQNGGKSWELLNTKCTANLFDVRFRTTMLGVAVGEGGKYAVPEEKSRFKGANILLPDGRYIISTGQVWSTIMRTTNGGRTWARIEAPTNMTLNGVSWLDDRRVIAIMSDVQDEQPSDGCFLTSEDTGLTWKVFYHIGAPCKAITIGPDRTGWVVGYPTRGDIKIVLPGQQPKSFNELTDEDKKNKQLTADVVRGLKLPAGLNATSFALNAKGPAGLDRDKVVANAEAIEGISTINHAAMMKDRAWIVGENGYLGVAERKDKKWQPFKPVELSEKDKVNFNAVALKDENVGLVVGDSGVCLCTTDGGKTWKRLETGTDKTLRSVVFVGKEHAAIVGDEGTVLYVGKAPE